MSNINKVKLNDVLYGIESIFDSSFSMLGLRKLEPVFSPGFIRYDTLNTGSGGDHLISDLIEIPAMTVLYVPRISKSNSTSLLTLCASDGTPTQCLLRGTSTANSTGEYILYPFVENAYVRVGGNKTMTQYMNYYTKAFTDDIVITADNFKEMNPVMSITINSGVIKDDGIANGPAYERTSGIVLPKGFTIEYWGGGSSSCVVLSKTDYDYSYVDPITHGNGRIQHLTYTATAHEFVRLSARVYPTTDAFNAILPPDKFYGWKVYYNPFHHEDVKHSPLYGKNLTVIGDSLIYGNGLGVGATWITNIGLKYNMNFTNLGDNSNPVAESPDSGETAMVDRIDTVPLDTDYFVLLGGANDKRYNVPIGTVDSSDKTTFLGAINNIVSAIHARCPKAKILLMTTYMRFSSTNTLGLGDADYAEAMITGGRANFVPVFDNFHNSGVNFMNDNQRSWMDESRNRQKEVSGVTTYIDDTHHFSIEGYEWITPIYEAALNAI